MLHMFLLNTQGQQARLRVCVQEASRFKENKQNLRA